MSINCLLNTKTKNNLWNLGDKDKIETIIDISVPSMTYLRDIIESHKNTDPEIRRPLNFNIVQTTKKVAKPLKQYIQRINTNTIKQDDIVVAGSGAAWTQVKKARRPHDIDLETNIQYMNRVKRDIINILSRKYTNITSKNIQIQADGTKVIQIMVRGRPVVDIKSHKRTGTILNIFDKEIYYNFKTQPPIKIQNIYYTRISELLARKGQGINRYYYTPKREGKPIGVRVEKDVKDFFIFEDSLKKSKSKKQTKSDPFGLSGFW